MEDGFLQYLHLGLLHGSHIFEHGSEPCCSSSPSVVATTTTASIAYSAYGAAIIAIYSNSSSAYNSDHPHKPTISASAFPPQSRCFASTSQYPLIPVYTSKSYSATAALRPFYPSPLPTAS
ncbi:hypothetical protein SLEP1_g11048 [Rubroshorea leprosula]|uniref:Uncharacterized protein n=1 Tax=Rubroshorea leprosula TaxID=152421 RepID=A0AAV5IJW9_9ROSI|nr:hypothetical protein SLEP1_g11048 [Rubroshorea leprosula]